MTAAPKALTTVALGAVATAVGLASLWFPFGRDQGLFFYVGREWLERGAIPYRDVWDHKTPLIYAVHAAAIAVFGRGMWSIRVVELLLVPLIGWLAAGVATPIGEKRSPGSWGAAWLMAALGYQGCLSFWDTAQCEVWCAAFALASLCAAMRMRNLGSAAFWAGALGSVCVWFKPPAIFFVPLALGAVVRRARQPRLVATFALGFAAVGALILGYFAAHGALADMYEILVGANAYYIEHEQTDPELRNFVLRYTFLVAYGPLLIVPLVASVTACLWGLWTKRAAVVRRYGLVLALACASVASVVVQMKWYIYHWGSLVAALACVAAAFHRDLARTLQRRFSETLAHAGSAGACALVALLLFAATPSSTAWYQTSTSTADYVRGLTTRMDFASSFDLPLMNYAYADSELVGRWLALHARPGDTLAVRFFEPQIYAISGLHHTGRFFWTMFLTDSRRAYSRDVWRSEDEAVFREKPPDYVVALLRSYDHIDDCRWFREWLGYRQVYRAGRFCVLELKDRSRSASACYRRSTRAAIAAASCAQPSSAAVSPCQPEYERADCAEDAPEMSKLSRMVRPLRTDVSGDARAFMLRL
jgi:hypothetical protein